MFFHITTNVITLFRDKNATVQRQPFITEFLAAAVIIKNSPFMANFRSFSVMFPFLITSPTYHVTCMREKPTNAPIIHSTY
jgi:hypothetical protein